MLTTLKVNPQEIETLNYERYYYPCPIIQKRLHALYIKATLNFSNEDVGKIVDAHRNTISVWLKTYQQGGIDALCKTDYGNRKSQLCEHAQSIIESFQQNPPANAAEAANRIESMTGIRRSITRVKVFLTRHGFGYRKMGHIPAQANAEQQRNWVTQKLQPVLDAAQEGQCHLLFADAAHFILQQGHCFGLYTAALALATTADSCAAIGNCAFITNALLSFALLLHIP
jgi:transposase